MEEETKLGQFVAIDPSGSRIINLSEERIVGIHPGFYTYRVREHHTSRPGMVLRNFDPLGGEQRDTYVKTCVLYGGSRVTPEVLKDLPKKVK